MNMSWYVVVDIRILAFGRVAVGGRSWARSRMRTAPPINRHGTDRFASLCDVSADCWLACSRAGSGLCTNWAVGRLYFRARSQRRLLGTAAVMLL